MQVHSLQLGLEALEQCLDGADLGRQLAALEVRGGLGQPSGGELWVCGRGGVDGVQQREDWVTAVMHGASCT